MEWDGAREQREFLGQADRDSILLEWSVNLKRESIHFCWRYVYKYADGVTWEQKYRKWKVAAKKGKKSFLKCIYSRVLGEKVRKRISPIKRTGRQRHWQQLTGTALSQPHELSMHGQATMLTFLQGGGWGVVFREHLSPGESVFNGVAYETIHLPEELTENH